MCRRSPCFPDPEGVVRLISAGYKDHLRVSWHPAPLHGQPFIWPLIAPIGIPGPYGQQCIFFTSEGKCELHDKGLKPIEGQVAIHNLEDGGLRKAVCFKWVSPLGIEVMKQFEDSDKEVLLLTEMLKVKT